MKQQMSGASGVSTVTSMQPPPLPKEDSSAKPPLPPEASYKFSNSMGVPPPNQNNLPLFSIKQSGNPPLPPGQPPPPPDNSSSNVTAGSSTKRSANSDLGLDSVKKLKSEDDDLTEAERKFDAQFKQWEEQFNKWKQQNANHPDKVSKLLGFCLTISVELPKFKSTFINYKSKYIKY